MTVLPWSMEPKSPSTTSVANSTNQRHCRDAAVFGLCERVADAFLCVECADVDGPHAIGAEQVGGLYRGGIEADDGACHSAAETGLFFCPCACALRLRIHDVKHVCAAMRARSGCEVEALKLSDLASVEQDERRTGAARR